MTRPRIPIRAALLLLASAAAQAQSTADPAIPPTILKHPKPRTPRSTQPSINPNLIVLDPAHGGPDDGAHLTGKLLEKDVTLSLSNRLRTQLIARGFTVITTHESASDDLASDQRVELSNRSHPAACLILHAASGGHGVHLFTSSLTPVAPSPTPASASGSSQDAGAPILPWDTAQAPSVAQSLRLANDLATALNGVRVPIVLGRVSIRPIDSLSCPAIALELAPLAAGSSGASETSPAEPAYQQRVAEAVATALTFWRGRMQSQVAAAQTARPPAPAKSSAKPKPRPANSPHSGPAK